MLPLCSVIVSQYFLKSLGVKNAVSILYNIILHEANSDLPRLTFNAVTFEYMVTEERELSCFWWLRLTLFILKTRPNLLPICSLVLHGAPTIPDS